MTRDVWVWGTLTPAEVAFAEAYGHALRGRADTVGARELGHAHRDRLAAHVVGALGEIAFRVFTGRPLRSIEAMLRTKDSADVDHYSVKTSSALFEADRWGAVFRYERDFALRRATHVVLMLERRPVLAIVGELSLEACRDARREAVWMAPQGATGAPPWVVPWGRLEPYGGPVDAARASVDRRCPHRMPIAQRCFTCEPVRTELFPPRPPARKGA